jgi:serine/threonine protein kinase
MKDIISVDPAVAPCAPSLSLHNSEEARLREPELSRDLSRKYLLDVHESISSLGSSGNDSARGLSFDQVYIKQSFLGEGGFAVVFRCQHWQTQSTYAVKEVVRSDYEKSGESLREEVNAMKALREGPHIVKLIEVFTSPDRTHLVMEEMRGGDLLAKLQEREVYTESEARIISRRLLEAISHCHKNRICHRDIKPENILLEDPTDDVKIKLADFGCAKRFNGKKCLHTLCGSPQYVAPELYISSEEGYDERCDVWSAGIVMYILLGGYAPFEGSNEDLPDIICDGFYEFHPLYWIQISAAPKYLISSLLIVNPDKRATVEQALESEWLRHTDMETFMRYTAVGNGSSTNTFDAWVRLQNDSSCSSIASFAYDEVFNLDHHGNTGGNKGMNHDSTRSLDIGDL